MYYEINCLKHLVHHVFSPWCTLLKLALSTYESPWQSSYAMQIYHNDRFVDFFDIVGQLSTTCHDCTFNALYESPLGMSLIMPPVILLTWHHSIGSTLILRYWKLMLSTLFVVHIIWSAHYLKSMLYIPCEALPLWEVFGFGVWGGSSTNNFVANLHAAYVSLPCAISSSKFTIAKQSIEFWCLMYRFTRVF